MTKIGLGCWHIWTTKIAVAAYDLGVRMFDTADIYQHGGSEIILAKMISACAPREALLICTKAGRNFTAWEKPWYKWHHSEEFSDWRPAYIEHALQESLRRLHTDYVDVFYLHNPKPQHMDRLRETMELLKTSGRIKATGVSVRNVAEGYEAVKLGYDFIQVKVEFTDDCFDLLSLANARRVQVVAKEPLHRGKLAQMAGPILKKLSDEWNVNYILTGTNNIEHLRDNMIAVGHPVREMV